EYSILDAMRYYGCPVGGNAFAHKHAMQMLGARGEPYTPEERRVLSDYCAKDTTDLAVLYRAMRPKIDLPTALIHGRYMISSGQQVHRGIPVNDGLRRYLDALPILRAQLINETPEAIAFFPGGHFCESRFLDWA